MAVYGLLQRCPRQTLSLRKCGNAPLGTVLPPSLYILRVALSWDCPFYGWLVFRWPSCPSPAQTPHVYLVFLLDCLFKIAWWSAHRSASCPSCCHLPPPPPHSSTSRVCYHSRSHETMYLRLPGAPLCPDPATLPLPPVPEDRGCVCNHLALRIPWETQRQVRFSKCRPFLLL